MSNRTNTLKKLEKEFSPKARGKQKERVREILGLYESGKIFSKVTMQKTLNRYLGRHPNEASRELYFYKTMANNVLKPIKEERKVEKKHLQRLSMLRSIGKITSS